MEMDLQEVKNRLLATNDEFSRLATEHSQCKQKLQHLSNLPHPTDAEQIEEVNLKKWKLTLKDRMEEILQQYRKEASLAP